MRGPPVPVTAEPKPVTAPITPKGNGSSVRMASASGRVSRSACKPAPAVSRPITNSERCGRHVVGDPRTGQRGRHRAEAEPDCRGPVDRVGSGILPCADHAAQQISHHADRIRRLGFEAADVDQAGYKNDFANADGANEGAGNQGENGNQHQGQACPAQSRAPGPAPTTPQVAASRRAPQANVAAAHLT